MKKLRFLWYNLPFALNSVVLPKDETEISQPIEDGDDLYLVIAKLKKQIEDLS